MQMKPAIAAAYAGKILEVLLDGRPQDIAMTIHRAIGLAILKGQQESGRKFKPNEMRIFEPFLEGPFPTELSARLTPVAMAVRSMFSLSSVRLNSTQSM